MNKFFSIALALLASISVWAAGSESLANVTKDYYEYTDHISFTGDNGMPWQAVGAIDCTTGGYRTLTVSAGVSGNGLYGNLTNEQTEDGVGTISFYVKGMRTGTGYGDRTFRVSAGDYSVEVTVNIPSNKKSYLVTATLNQTDVSTIAITALETVSGETSVWGIYNIAWTSYNGRTFSPTFAIDPSVEYVASGTDTVYYAPSTVDIELSSLTEGAVFYYTTDGTEPSTSSASGNIVALPTGADYTVKALAITSHMGTSDVATLSISTKRGHIVQNDCSDVNLWEGNPKSNTTLSYISKSGAPIFALMRNADEVITPAIVHPVAISLYATSSNQSLDISYQLGTVVLSATDSVWEPASDWISIRTIAKDEFLSSKFKRFQIIVPEEVANSHARLRVEASGTTVYVDDINYIADYIAQLPVPAVSVGEGVVAKGTTTILSAVAGATLHYSINGSEIQTTEIPLEITLNEATTIRAYATQDGVANSWTAEYIYKVNDNPTDLQSATLDTSSLPHKVMQNGQIRIVKGDNVYDLCGRLIR